MYRGVDCCSPVADLTCRLDTCRAHTNQSMVTISRARCYIIIIIIIISVLYYCYYHYTLCVELSRSLSVYIYIYILMRVMKISKTDYSSGSFSSLRRSPPTHAQSTLFLSLWYTHTRCVSIAARRLP